MECSKFEFGEYVRIPKQKNIFVKGYTPNSSKKVFVIKRIKNVVPRIFVICDLNGKEIVGTFQGNELQKINQTKLERLQ